MLARFRSWWQQVKQHRIAIGVTILVLVVIIALIIAGYQFDWTGFNRYVGPPLKQNQQYQPEKTLWDWLQLLIIPLVLAIGGYLFNLTVSRNEQKSTQLRDQTEREIASDNQREAALQTYIDRMSELLLDKKLRESAENDEVRNIARVRTLTILSSLDDVRKRNVLQFLHESGLIQKGKYIIDLNGADLREADLGGAAPLSSVGLDLSHLEGADLHEAHLRGADLRGADLGRANLEGAQLGLAHLEGAWLRSANLRGADLEGAFLDKAHLRKADLTEAKVTMAQLDKADSLQGAIMPDGSTHP